jgi:hypothetical protein
MLVVNAVVVKIAGISKSRKTADHKISTSLA